MNKVKELDHFPKEQQISLLKVMCIALHRRASQVKKTKLQLFRKCYSVGLFRRGALTGLGTKLSALLYSFGGCKPAGGLQEATLL